MFRILSILSILWIFVLWWGSFVFGQEIVIDPITKKIYVTTWNAQNTGDIITTGDSNFANTYVWSGVENSTWDTTLTTGTDTTTDATATSDDIQAPIITIDTTQGDEFIQALNRMYANGLTMYNNVADYRPDDSLTREEAAKIVGQAYILWWYNQSTKNSNCNFADKDLFNPTLADFITQVCQWEIFVGSEGNFMPYNTLTKAQASTVLVRILEGKKSDESKSPRWIDYYKKAQAIGLTADSQANFDNAISRRDMAIFMWRVQQVVSNEQLKVLSLNSMNKAVSPDQDNTTSLFVDYSTIAANINVSDDPELQEALNWMFDNGLTSFSNPNEYKPFNLLSREQAAKMLVKFAWLYGDVNSLVQVPEQTCVFADMDSVIQELRQYVTQVCRIGLLMWNRGNFNPQQNITKAHFIVSLMRLLQGKHLDENVTPRWKNYFELAESLDVISPADVVNFDNNITRYEVALFLYRFKVKYLLLQNANNATLQNEIITIVPNSVQTWVSWLPEAHVYVSTVPLSNANFSLGYIDIFGDRYTINKTSTENYFNNNFVWYGDVLDFEDNKVGTISLIVSNNMLVEWNVRFTSWQHDYLIVPVANTQAYYALRTIQKTSFTTTNTGSTTTWANN